MRSKKVKGKSGDFPGYPIYPANEDIYQTDKEEKDIDQEDIRKRNK